MLRIISGASAALLTLASPAATQVAHPVTVEQKIANALSAAPTEISEDATVIDWPTPPHADPPVLRQGTNGWTCLPSPPDTEGNDPLCLDEVFIRVRLALHRDEGIELDRVGLGYMLQGGGSLDENGVQYIGPHTMMVLPTGGPLAEGLESNTPEGTIVFSPLVPGALLVVMPVAPGS